MRARLIVGKRVYRASVTLARASAGVSATAGTGTRLAWVLTTTEGER